jgi:hypothetical protein
MKKLFREISTITSVQGLFLLSEHGEVLFESGWQVARDGFGRIKTTLRSIGGAKCAIFAFKTVGYVSTKQRSDTSL